MKINLAGIVEDSIVDGEGCRLTVFVQGCPHHCPGCQNPETHDFACGKEFETEDILQKMEDNPLLSGITFSGGEPFCQPKPLVELAAKVHQAGKNVWAYSGYTLDELLAMKRTDINQLLEEVDVLVDGAYVEAKRDLTLRFRGSKNQRLIDLKKTRMDGELHLLS